MERFSTRVSDDLCLPEAGVSSVLALLEDGHTVPFIARYRKEATGSINEVQIRQIQERHQYLRDLEARRSTVLHSITEQGKLTEVLRERIAKATTKTELEDLYLPYKPKRRTRGTIARTRGLSLLAERILAQPSTGDALREAEAFVDVKKEVPDASSALTGAKDIVAETIAENMEIRSQLRKAFRTGVLVSKPSSKKKREERTKFEQYYDFREPVAKIPSHRYLAMRRGEGEGVLKISIETDVERSIRTILRHMGHRSGTPFADQLAEAAHDSHRRLVGPSLKSELLAELKERSDVTAVEVFADNLRSLLLAAPLGAKAVVGIDPGLRTGCKCASIDATGKFLDHLTIFLTRGEDGVRRAQKALTDFLVRHKPVAIAIGNGTGGREAEAFVRKLLSEQKADSPFVVSVNEAGASVYSASDIAREEFPDLDLTVRGAISIARRLQDPLAELVKIEPKSIGVGQYQHDVHQPLLKRKLADVVESSVNHVGVEINTASAALLSYVAGIGPKLAKKVVDHRDRTGPFRTRKAILKVAGLGPRVFEQSAGFLRISAGDNPLDGSGVHPERYGLVERMAKDLKTDVLGLLQDPGIIDRIELSNYEEGEIGRPTLTDIVAELKRPGRDPRASFEPPKFRADVHSLSDLKVDMVLEGVVTNVVAFGAFVDIGVHQDGLVHISEMSDRYVSDPKKVVQTGQRVRVRVINIDAERNRISLSIRGG